MLFTSTTFLFIFLPVVLGLFYTTASFKKTGSLLLYLLIAASLIFYGYKAPENILILLTSVLGNFAFAKTIEKGKAPTTAFWLGIAFNLCLLGVFKYTNFALENIGLITNTSFSVLDVALPLAISFYTFQQIAYLSDVKKGIVQDTSFKTYVLFVTFFPQLIIGPIVHHSEMMPQFKNPDFGSFQWDKFKLGYLYLFSGLLKKIVFSDACAKIVDPVYADPSSSAGFAESWIATIAFSFQIYFDFSGYSDMAMGIALLFGILLPINFDSPYKAKNFTEFWRGWHMTFSRWLRDYLYIPLGGNKKGSGRAATNAVIVFLLGGLWHGAAWTFVLWGLFHGICLSMSRALEKLKLPIPSLIGIAITFLAVTLSWVLFRANNFDDALLLYGQMAGLQGFDLTLSDTFKNNAIVLGAAAIIAFLIPNTHKLLPKLAELSNKLPKPAIIVMMLVFWGMTALLDLDSSGEFIYFDF